MPIERVIKQRKFANEHEKLVVNILYTASWLDGINIQRLKPFSISPQQYNVLRILRGANPNPIRLSDITERMIDKNSNATRLVEKLRQKGFLERDVCKDNRRQVDITITNKGMDLLGQIDNGTLDWPVLMNSVLKDEAIELNRILDKLRAPH